jgi:hypothetical protein
MEKNKNKVKILIFAVSIIIIFILNRHFGWSTYLSNTENFDFFKNVVKENMILAIIIYIIKQFLDVFF